MALPRIATQVEMIEQPSTGKQLKFRPYLVREEKVLMQARESNQVRDIFLAIKEVLKACCMEKTIDVDQLVDDMPIFDLEMIFLRLRAISVSNRETIMITDTEDGKEYPALLDFGDIKLIKPEKPIDKVIKINKDISLIMKYPSTEIYDDTNESILKKLKAGEMFDLIIACIDQFISKSELLKFTKEEIIEFLNDLPIPARNQIKEFLLNMPKVYHKIDYINSLGSSRYIEFKSVIDFFFFV